MKPRKSHPLMLISVCLSWLMLNGYFAMSYLEVINTPKQIIGKTVAVCIVLWILIASFYACFHAISFIYSCLVKRFAKEPAKDYSSQPQVAVLYTCMDDMQESALASCLDQDYSNYHVFVTDDSQGPCERERVDAFCSRYPERITRLRRRDHTGHKAGNLNYALKQIGEAFTYFAIVDADELLPKDFIKETVAIAEANPDFGFVQAAHRMYGKTNFARQAGDGIDLHWSYYLPARNLFGFVYFFGHGALLRTAAVKAVGGIPEIVSEDVALAMRLRAAGFRGYFASDIICQEEVPPTYRAFRTRNAKVVRGTLELIWREFPTFLRQKNIGWTERLDLLIATAGLYLPIPFLGFVILLHFVMPLFLTETYSVSLRYGSDAGLGYIYTSAGLFRALWGWEALLFTAFTVFAPLCYVIPDLLRSPRKVLGYIFRITPVSLSTVPQTVLESMNWLGTHRASFDNTGQRGPNRKSPNPRLELWIGFAVTIAAIVTGSLFLLAFGLSVVMIPLLMLGEKQSRLTGWLLPIPLTLTLLAFISVPALLLGFSGAFVGVALAHH